MKTAEISLGWKAVRDAAVKATRWGWPVMPGTFLGANQRWYGREGASRLRPIEDTWAQTPVTDRIEAYEVWSENPYGVLLVCGCGVDVLELPEELGALLPDAAVPQVPIAVTTPPRQWLLFTATGSGALSGELAQAGVRLHTAGSWVALPPHHRGTPVPAAVAGTTPAQHRRTARRRDGAARPAHRAVALGAQHRAG